MYIEFLPSSKVLVWSGFLFIGWHGKGRIGLFFKDRQGGLSLILKIFLIKYIFLGVVSWGGCG
jgi:hypothetical protein